MRSCSGCRWRRSRGWCTCASAWTTRRAASWSTPRELPSTPVVASKTSSRRLPPRAFQAQLANAIVDVHNVVSAAMPRTRDAETDSDALDASDTRRAPLAGVAGIAIRRSTARRRTPRGVQRQCDALCAEWSVRPTNVHISFFPPTYDRARLRGLLRCGPNCRRPRTQVTSTDRTRRCRRLICRSRLTAEANGRAAALPGAPYAFVSRQSAGYRDSLTLPEWCRTQGDFPPSVQDELTRVFRARARKGGAKLRFDTASRRIGGLEPPRQSSRSAGSTARKARDVPGPCHPSPARPRRGPRRTAEDRVDALVCILRTTVRSAMEAWHDGSGQGGDGGTHENDPRNPRVELPRRHPPRRRRLLHLYDAWNLVSASHSGNTRPNRSPIANRLSPICREPLRVSMRRAVLLAKTKNMIRVTDDVVLDDREVSERFVRASGPGGQNVNKVSTAVELRFNVLASSLATRRQRTPDQACRRACDGGRRSADRQPRIADAGTESPRRARAVDRVDQAGAGAAAQSGKGRRGKDEDPGENAAREREKPTDDEKRKPWTKNAERRTCAERERRRQTQEPKNEERRTRTKNEERRTKNEERRTRRPKQNRRPPTADRSEDRNRGTVDFRLSTTNRVEGSHGIP